MTATPRDLWIGGDPARQVLADIHDMLIGDDEGGPERIPDEVVDAVRDLWAWHCDESETLADTLSAISQPGDREWGRMTTCDAVRAELSRIVEIRRSPLALIPARSASFESEV